MSSPRRSDGARPTPIVAGIGIAVGIFLVAVAHFAAMRGASEFAVRGARDDVDRWRTGKHPLSAARHEEIEAEFKRGLAFDTSSPHIMEDLGRLYSTRVELNNPLDPGVREQRLASLQLLTKVLAARPTSAHAYVNVAILKFQLGEFDREFSNALEQSLKRGPWEPPLQLLTIEMGLAAWQTLSDELRDRIKDVIHTQANWKLGNQKAALVAMLNRHRRADLNCLLDAGPTRCAGS